MPASQPSSILPPPSSIQDESATSPNEEKQKYKEKAWAYWPIETLICVILIGFAAWWFRSSQKDNTPNSPEVSRTFIPLPAVPVPPTPPPVRPKQEPPKPWVTDEEIERAHKARCSLIQETPEYIIGLKNLYGDDRVAIYLRKWIKILYQFDGVIKKKYNKTDFLIIKMSNILGIFLALEAKQWEDKIATIKK